MAKRSVKINFLLNSAYQILLVITPLVTAPYLSRVLGASQTGVFSYTQSIANYFVMFATLGMSTYGVRVIALCGEDRTARSRAFWSAYGSQFCIAVVVAVVYLVYVFVVHAGGLLVSLVWGLWVLSAVGDISWLLFGCEEFKIPTVRSFATKLASLVIIFGFVHEPGDVWLYVFAVAGSYFVNMILIWPFVRRYVDSYRPNWCEVFAHFKPNIGLFIPVIAVSLYTSLDKIMLGSMSDMSQSGYFQYAEQVSRMPLHVITALGTVMMPRMVSLLTERRRDEAISVLGTSLWFMLVCAFAFAFGIFAVAPEFVPVFLGDGYKPCELLMVVMCGIIPVICVTNVIGKQYLLPSQRDREYTLSLIIGAAVNVTLNIVLIPRFAALGTAIATVAAEVTILVVQALEVRRELPLGRYAAQALPLFLIGIAMALVVRLFVSMAEPCLEMGVYLLVAEILVGAAFYFSATLLYCFATRNPQFIRLFGGIVTKVYKKLPINDGKHSDRTLL